MPNETMSLLDMDHVQPELPKKKRGRKPLRPNDPTRTKTEEKDKFGFEPLHLISESMLILFGGY